MLIVAFTCNDLPFQFSCIVMLESELFKIFGHFIAYSDHHTRNVAI
jgi:hypothetical protein